jgi:membrane protease YdiL (CAAX protease family)
MRIVALMEVVFACCLCHLAYRALQHTFLGEWEQTVGRRFLPGLVLTVFSLGAISLHGNGFAAFGITAKNGRSALLIGLLAALLFVVIGGAILVLGLRSSDAQGSVAQAGGWTLGTVLLLALLRCRRAAKWERLGSSSAALIGLFLLVTLLALPLLLGLGSAQPSLITLCSVVWLFVFTGFGEETFFRGYVQSRLNLVLGRPYKVMGVEFGPGLLVASGLFGMLHALNTVDYFMGRYDIAWGSGFVSVFSGFCYGSLREKTGSILAGGTAHGIAGALTEIPRVLAA